MRALAALFAIGLQAQTLQLRSEFQRIDPFGNVVAPDRTERSREIISPAVARNAHAIFHVAITAPEGMPAFLYVQQNPELFQITVYRERFTKTSKGWIPDALERVTLPYTVILPDYDAQIPGQTTSVFLLDIFVPPKVQPQRTRVQAVVKAGDLWLQYPMEMRVAQAVVPDLRWVARATAGPEARADAFVEGPVRAFLAGSRETGTADRMTVRQFIRRSALQDLSLARGDRGIRSGIAAARPLGAEWFLRIRDYLYQRKAGGT